MKKELNISNKQSNMNNSKLIVGALLMVAQLSFAQDGSFTLEAAKSYAMEHHITIANADHDITDAKERANEAGNRLTSGEHYWIIR